jgi:hypothetical protein
VLLALPREPNRIALFFFLLFAVPPIQSDISGFGVVNYFFSIDWLRLLSLVILLPAWLSLRSQPDTAPFGRLTPDKLLGIFLVLQFCLMLAVSTVTNTLRIGAFYAFLDIFLPYYVASRGLRTIQDFRDALAAFVVAALLLSAIAIFEFGWHWLLYSHVDDALGIYWSYGGYLPRGNTLRSIASTGHSIALGYVITIAIGFMLYLRKSSPSPFLWRCGMVLLTGGLLAALSRGPWVGAAGMFLVFIATGPNAGRSLIQLAMLAVIGVPLLLLSPLGPQIIDHLPFVGRIDAQSITYRQRLFEISIQVIKEHPIFGAYDFFYSPAMQELKQGSEGFIDLVNTYAGVGLSSGLVGLSLFVGFFTTILVQAFKGMRRLSDRASEEYLLGRALLAVLVAVMMIIFTVSSITVIGIVYWSVAGLGVAFARMLALKKAPQKSLVTAGGAGMQPAGLRGAH